MSENPAQSPKRTHWTRLVRAFVLLSILVFLLLLAIAVAPLPGPMKASWDNEWMETSHSLYLAMFQYSVDNNGNFPNGKSSTAVFQKLVDGGYVTDSTIFYIPFAGKTKTRSTKLRPENVCWDVTASVGKNDSDELPLIFMTGYKISYIPGGAAVPLIKPYPPFGFEPRTWLQWWNGEPSALKGGAPGIAVAYKGASSIFRKPSQADGTISNFIPPTFYPKGKTYRQLTPEGSLP